MNIYVSKKFGQMKFCKQNEVKGDKMHKTHPHLMIVEKTFYI